MDFTRNIEQKSKLKLELIQKRLFKTSMKTLQTNLKTCDKGGMTTTKKKFEGIQQKCCVLIKSSGVEFE